jgi:ATP-dependent Lon protease
MIAKFALKIEDFEARKVDEKIMTVIKDEMQKLSSLERNSPEFNVIRSYLDWLTSVPWKVLTEDRSVYSPLTCIVALKSRERMSKFFTPCMHH